MTLLRLIDRFRGALVAPPIVYAVITFTNEYENDVVTWPIAILLFFLGLVVRVWAQQHLHYRLRGIKMKLTTTGPYAITRNPIYIGNTIICLALITASELLWLIPFQLLWCAIVYNLVVRYEEGRLIEKYGQTYTEYITQVPRWFPRWPSGFSPRYIEQFLIPSISANIHNTLLLVPFIAKELISPWFER